MLRAAVLLILSNVFMTFAWYGHLRHTHRVLWLVVLVSWGIAFFEYCLQVPANRIGFAAGMTGAELKTLQEVITLTVFAGFSVWYLREPLRWSTVAGFLCIALGALLVFAPWAKRSERERAAGWAARPVAVNAPLEQPAGD
jgi:uncharacterized protein (DUF486 family)